MPVGADTEWRHGANEKWVCRAVDYQAAGIDLLLAGQTPLGELLATPSAPQLEAISACLLDCDDETRVERLKARGPEWFFGLTERPRSRTEPAVGYTTSPVLKTGYAESCKSAWILGFLGFQIDRATVFASVRASRASVSFSASGESTPRSFERGARFSPMPCWGQLARLICAWAIRAGDRRSRRLRSLG